MIEYQRYGIAHRKDCPAFMWHDGDVRWLRYGKYHRIDGPARIWDDGYEEYWINGVESDII